MFLPTFVFAVGVDLDVTYFGFCLFLPTFVFAVDLDVTDIAKSCQLSQKCHLLGVWKAIHMAQKYVIEICCAIKISVYSKTNKQTNLILVFEETLHIWLTLPKCTFSPIFRNCVYWKILYKNFGTRNYLVYK